MSWAQSPLALLGLGSLSGSLFVLSIPQADLFYLAWFCLVPSLLPITQLSDIRAAKLGLVCGLVMGCGRVYWISETLQVYGNIPFVAGILTTSALIIYLALYPALFFFLINRIRFESKLFPWLAASLWIILEWVQNWLISGFPWELMGYSQYLNRIVVQLASLTGIYGISFVLILVNASLAQLLILRRWSFALPATLLLCCVFSWGYYRLTYLDQDSESEQIKRLNIGVIQGSIPQNTKWSIIPLSMERYSTMTRMLAGQTSLDLIIYPETALPFRLFKQADSLYYYQIVSLAKEISTPLLVGSLEANKSNTKLFNRAFLFTAQGKIAHTSDKVHLVPFGEYLPFPWFFQYMQGLTSESGIFNPGDRHKLLYLPTNNTPFGVFICYESIFPEISRQLTELGAVFLVNTTNDAWFGHSAAPYQHFSMSVLRAVETGRTVIRAANTGISGVISPSGAILQATPLFKPLSFTTTIKPRTEITPYIRFGNYIIGIAAGFLCLWIAFLLYQKHVQIKRERLEALQELALFASSPRPLKRPLVILHGYNSSKKSWHFLTNTLHQCTTNSATHLWYPDLNHNLSIPLLADHISLPPEDTSIDVIGHSMGGLLALELAHHTSLQPQRLLLLATPLGGTIWAYLAQLAKFPYPNQLKDMSPSSPFIRSLGKSLKNLQAQAEIFSFAIKGDPIVSSPSIPSPHWPHKSYTISWFTNWRQRHTLIYSDPRPVRDLIVLLQDREPPNV